MFFIVVFVFVFTTVAGRVDSEELDFPSKTNGRPTEREEQEPIVPPNFVNAIKFFKTFGRHATPDHLDVTIDELLIDSMDNSGALISGADEVILDLTRLNRLLVLQESVLFIDEQKIPAEIELLQPYFTDLIEAFKIKVTEYFCSHHRCQNGGLCSLKPMEGILSYRTVLALPQLFQQVVDEIGDDPDALGTFLMYFGMVPNISIDRIGDFKDGNIYFRAIFTHQDIEIVEKLHAEISGRSRNAEVFLDTVPPALAFNGETLAFLGRVLITLSEIAYDDLSTFKAAEDFVSCQCSNKYTGLTCSESVSDHISMMTESCRDWRSTVES